MMKKPFFSASFAGNQLNPDSGIPHPAVHTVANRLLLLSCFSVRQSIISMTVSATILPFGGRFRWGLLFFLITVLPLKAEAAADSKLFPEYRSIVANIAFWEKIYSTYSVNTAIIHDRENLGRVYGVIALVDRRLPGSAKQNELLIDKQKNHYAGLLRRLAHGNPHSAEEKRVAQLFSSRSSPQTYLRAADNIRAQTGLKEQFLEGVIRSGAYLPAFKKTFTSHGLPEDLAYLPHVESSFNPSAFSKFGASGMWQFTTDTGRDYLQIDYIIDERRDPFIAADAAARFLKNNYRQLGTWPLALTAYNYGTAGMKRAKAEQGGYEQIFLNYRKGWFKFAARNFYPSFLAAVKAAKKIEASGRYQLDVPVPFSTLRLPGYADSSALCRALAISCETLARYNPALREPVWQGQKYLPQGYHLKLPAQFGSSQQLAQLAPNLFHREQRRSRFYQVRPGDTAGSIAQAHKVSLQSLVAANNLDKQAMVRIGQNLRIPATNGERQQLEAGAAHAGITVLSQQKKSPPAKIDGTPLMPDLAVSGNLKVSGITKKGELSSGQIEVQPDETIGLIASWLRSTPQSIRLANLIGEEVEIMPGQIITVDFVTIEAEAFEAIRFDFHQEKQQDFFSAYKVIDVTSYIVKPGDTLWDLCANTFEIPLWLLKKYNDSLSFTKLDVAASLLVPVVKEL